MAMGLKETYISKVIKNSKHIIYVLCTSTGAEAHADFDGTITPLSNKFFKWASSKLCFVN
jgi:hypothetical protein